VIAAAGLTAAQLLEVLRARVDQTEVRGDESSDGPAEQVVADADLEWFADREEQRDERAFWGGAA